MNKLILTSIVVVATLFSAKAQNESDNTQPKFEVKVITSIESIVPHRNIRTSTYIQLLN